MKSQSWWRPSSAWSIIIQCGIDFQILSKIQVLLHIGRKMLKRCGAPRPGVCRPGAVGVCGTWSTGVRGAPGGVWRPSPTVLLHTPGGEDLGWKSARAALDRELETRVMEMFLGG